MTTEIRLRRCQPGDEDALALVGQATFLETFAGVLGGRDILAHCAQAHSADLYRGWLSDPAYALWLAETERGDAPVGYGAMAPAQLPLPDLRDDDLELKRIYLLGKFHGGGTGRRLLAQALDHASQAQAGRLLLGVYAGNAAAIAFYRRAGFVKLGNRRFKVGAQDYEDDIRGKTLPHAD